MEAVKVITETKILGKRVFSRGKVSDSYFIPGWWRTENEEKILRIFTDRISAFDSVLPTGVPDKGKVLNLLTISICWA